MNTKDELMNHICNQIIKDGANELAIILNGSYVTHSGKLVYIKVEQDSGTDQRSLKCYYKSKDSDGKWAIQDITFKVLNEIYLELSSNQFRDFVVEHVNFLPCSRALISSNVSLGFLILESPLYAIGKKLMEYSEVNMTTSLENVTLTADMCRSLKQTFRRHSYKIYQGTVYNKVQNRIIQKIYKRNPFYNIQKTFIPTFIRVRGLYNPFFDDKEYTNYEKTDLYKMAISQNRLVDVNSEISCYMLTHKEICQAFHLSRFMRFTPDFMYKVYIGLLHPEYSEFPNKIGRVRVPAINSDSIADLKKHYTNADYAKELESLSAAAENQNYTEEQRQKFKKMLNTLLEYVEIDTLREACIQNRKALTTIGPSILDTSISERDLYSIIQNATI